MLPNIKDSAYLWDILDASTKIVEYTESKTYKDFEESSLLRSAVERQIEIIGEAARKVSDDYKTANPQIPWQGMIAQRNVLAHEYGEILIERIWVVATVRVPELVELVKGIIPPSPEDN